MTRTIQMRAVALSTLWLSVCAVDDAPDEGGSEGTGTSSSSSSASGSEESGSEASGSEESGSEESGSEESGSEASGSEESGSEESGSEESGSEESGSEESGSEESGSEESGCEVGTLDCACDMGACELELICVDGLCVPPPECGDGNLDPGEDCDDGNLIDNDGCESDCSLIFGIVELAAGSQHTCARTSFGEVYCWGNVSNGRLGLPSLTENVGDDELPSEVLEPLELGGPAVAIAAGDAHSCAIIQGGELVCWGWANNGSLGYGNLATIGDNEDPIDAGFVNVPEAVEAVTIGDDTTCVIVEDGDLRCWGSGTHGKLGLGNTNDIGDTETPASVPPIDLDGPVIAVAADTSHTCALTEAGELYCWGFNLSGQLGLGHTMTIGDDELPLEAGHVAVGVPVTQISIGDHHTCVLTDSGGVRCWGLADSGQLGRGNEDKIGDDELLDVLEDIDLGGVGATSIVAGDGHNCAILVDDSVRCWGSGSFGILGSGDNVPIGDDELPTAIDPVDVGDLVSAIALTTRHSCVITQAGGVRCWGPGGGGRLGYGNTSNIGDDEVPSSAGDVSFLP